MVLAVFILNRVEVLEELLEALSDQGVGGATILSSTGMARALLQQGKGHGLLSSLRANADEQGEENRTLLMVLHPPQVMVVEEAIRQVVGDLTLPDTGVFFTVPVDHTWGIR